jgi:hypothetical protein
VRLGGKVHHDGDVVLSQQPPDEIAVADVPSTKLIVSRTSLRFVNVPA